MEKTFAGGRLRHLRESRAMSQADLARVLEISPSYLNQIEHNSRPLTVPVLLRITQAFGVDAEFFANSDTARLVADVKEALLDEVVGVEVTTSELNDLATNLPSIAQALVRLHRSYRNAVESTAALTAENGLGLHGSAAAPLPHEEVRDFFYERENYVAELDERAERMALETPLRRGEVLGALKDRLRDRYGLGFETVCHRLSTLQRPKQRGVPFSFMRVDRAGNMSKRQSAAGFHFTRVGGTCPLWNIYEAFAQPGKILTQIAALPDGKKYFWIARTVSRNIGGYGSPGKTFSVGLGCELRHAGRLVYSRGLDLDEPAAATPIGMGCKVCERPACSQRAFPTIGKQLTVDENTSTFVPYPAVPLHS